MYVQLLNQVTSLEELSNVLQQFYGSKVGARKQLVNPYRGLLSYTICYSFLSAFLGQLCAIKYGRHGRYYRAAVVCRPDPINVQACDY